MMRTKRYLLVIVALLAIVGKAFSEEKLEVLPLTVSPGSSATINITLTNPDAQYTALQFDLYLPEGIELEKEDGEFVAELSRVSESHSIGISEMNGYYRLILSSVKNQEITGESGKVIALKVKASNSISNGTKNGSLKNIKLVNKDNTGLEIEVEAFAIEVLSYMTGDVNRDNTVNNADVVEIVNYIIGKPSNIFNAAAADVNSDTQVDIADVARLIGLVK